MQDALFPDDDLPASAPGRTAPRKPRSGGKQVMPRAPDPAHLALAADLPALAWLGTSSWTYPGWAGLVWDGDYAEPQLSRHGLQAYAQHPLLRAVSLDRAFYRPLSASQYAAYAAQVPEHFRFTVKAPALVADATVRSESGRAVQTNPAFLDPTLAVQEFAEPALQGLGSKLGALVFQLSPLPPPWIAQIPSLLPRLEAMLTALPGLASEAPGAVVAVEVRDPEWLTPEFAAVLRRAGATYCLGLHAKMPAVEEQLPVLRALWPGPLVCRWNLHRRHGAYGYEDAAALYQPYSRLVDPDLQTRETLARVIRATTQAGYPAYVTLSNKAEGCAPLSVEALARAIQTVTTPTVRAMD